MPGQRRAEPDRWNRNFRSEAAEINFGGDAPSTDEISDDLKSSGHLNSLTRHRSSTPALGLGLALAPALALFIRHGTSTLALGLTSGLALGLALAPTPANRHGTSRSLSPNSYHGSWLSATALAGYHPYCVSWLSCHPYQARHLDLPAPRP